MSNEPNIEVITTVRIGDATKTFTSTATANGTPVGINRTARQLARSVAEDAADWINDMERDFR